MINFAPGNVSIMANSLLQPIWNDFYARLKLRLLVNSANYITYKFELRTTKIFLENKKTARILSKTLNVTTAP